MHCVTTKEKCEHLHGHNYGVKVVVEGSRLSPDTELLMDFGDLKAILKEVLETLDHQYLNELPPFDRINPSSENLARHIWQARRRIFRSRSDFAR